VYKYDLSTNPGNPTTYFLYKNCQRGPEGLSTNESALVHLRVAKSKTDY
jgi:hypothetical protein